jgi:predicted nucleic acid-binding protein
MSNLVLDTNAVIFLTTKGSIISSDLELELNQAELFMSVISEIELFSKPMLPLHPGLYMQSLC